MTTESLMTAAPQTTEGAAASPEATQSAATAAATDGQQTAAPEQTAAAPAQQPQTEEQPKAPENYEFKPIDGVDVAPEVLESFTGIAKELGLTQDAAQKVLDKMAPALQSRQLAQVEAIRAEWGQQSTTDQEFGGDKLQENLAVAKKALDTFGTPELAKLLNESGLGNHPEVIRVFYRAGKAISEDSKLVTGRQPSGQASDARRLYAASNMNP